MSVFEDPTPCPQPRHGAMRSSRLSVFDGNEATNTLNSVSRVPGLRDAKPRRPRKRQSVGWDPTVDIYEDTFALKQDAPAPRQPSHTVVQSASESLAESKSSRRSTLFAQPAQRPVLATMQDAANESSPRKRRLSSIVEQEKPAIGKTASASSEIAPHRQSVLHKEARRRTIYVPNDTTVFTIHPGASLQDQAQKPGKPRKSDVFLDLATLKEDEVAEEACSQPANEETRTKRAPRTSLAAAPRRAPLQASTRQTQPQAVHVDIMGQGGGKENMPPGGVAPIPKRLGKRASFIIPEKPASTLAPTLVSLDEGAELNLGEQPVKSIILDHGIQRPQSQAPPARKAASRQSIAGLPAPRRVSQSQSTLLSGNSNRRGSHQLPSSMNARPRPTERVPTSLSVPSIGTANTNNTQQYAALSEDIAHPELYEENWLSHQEQSIAQLVNSLFEKANGSPSVPLDHKSIRQQLLSVYHSSDNVLLHKRLQASLRFGALSIPPETFAQVARFKDDFGQRQRFLDLWTKTYDLESLQLAAEVVVGRRRVSSPRNSGADIPSANPAKSTSKFLQTFLVQNQDLGNRSSINVSGPGSPAGKNSSPSAAHCWRRTALRSLMMVHLLDAGQRSGLFQGRNLFQTTSPYKSSSAVLHGLCRLLIPSVGDVSRVVSHLGYHVGHVQFPLEELSYQVGNLATDLRDGVRLTRLVECLLYPPGSLDLEKDGLTTTLASGDVLTTKIDYNSNQGAQWPLSQHLKYPCAGRPQRVLNTEIALAALTSISDADKGLLKDITAADIVNGHREKTVKLLWGLVSRWGLGALVDFNLVEYEIYRLRRLRERRAAFAGVAMETEVDDAELPYLTPTERQPRLLQSWTRQVGALHGVNVSNLTTSFASGAAYDAIAKEYNSSLLSLDPQHNNTTDLKSLLLSLGCSRSFLGLFAQPSTCPSKTTTTSLLAFLASRILPIAVPHQAALTIQRAFRSREQRWQTKRKVMLKRIATECAAVAQAQQTLIGAIVTLQRWWRRCVVDRREGRRRWV